MLARESNMLLAKPGMVLASYGQWPLEQQLPTASYNDLKKEKDKHRRNSPICAPLPASFCLWEDPIFTPRTGKIPSAATPQTRESASAGMHCTHPREVSDAQATPGAVLSNCKQLPVFQHEEDTLFWPNLFRAKFYLSAQNWTKTTKCCLAATTSQSPSLPPVCLGLLGEPFSLLLLYQTLTDNT